MLNNNLYDIINIKAPSGGMHEELSDLPLEDSCQSQFSRYSENLRPKIGVLACRNGTKEIMDWFRDIDNNVLNINPRDTKITNIYYANKTDYLVFYEKKYIPTGLNPAEDEGNSIKIPIDTNHFTEESYAVCKRGSLMIYLADDAGSTTQKRLDEFVYDEENKTILLPPMVKDRRAFFDANNIRNVEFIIKESVGMRANEVIENTFVGNLGTRETMSFATNSDYVVAATGTDPILVWDITSGMWATPLFNLDGHKPFGENVDRKRAYNYEFPILSSVAYGKERFWGVIVNPKTLKPTLGVSYTRVPNEARDWFFTVKYTDPKDAEWSNTEKGKLSVPILYLDLKGKHHSYDAILGIDFFEDTIAFLGNNKIQLWNGDTPLEFYGVTEVIQEDAESFFKKDLGFNVDTYMKSIVVKPTAERENEINVLKWFKSFDFGIVDAGLYTSTNLGLFFVSHTGIKIIAYDETFITPKINVQDIDGVNQLIKNYIQKESSLKKKSSFFYRQGGCFGFRFGSQCIVGHILSKKFAGWTLYTGTFNEADSFSLDFSGSLSMVNDEFGDLPHISIYDDGESILPDWYNIQYHNPVDKRGGSWADQVSYIDDNNQNVVEDRPIIIEFVMHLDLQNTFVNKYFEILADYFSTLKTENDNRIELTIWSDLPNVRVINGQSLDPKPIIGGNSTEMRWIGDKFYTLKINEAKMMIEGAYPLIERCKFVGNTFNLGLRGQIKYSCFVFKGVKLYGAINR